MGHYFIPTRMTVKELCVAALMEAADGIEAARDEAAFRDAMDGNHRLWLAVREVSAVDGWAMPSFRDTDFVIHFSARLGSGVNDADVEAIIAINRRVAASLADHGDIACAGSGIRLAYREGGGGGYVPWMLEQIYKKGRLRSIFDPTSEQARLHPTIRAAALKFAREFEVPGTEANAAIRRRPACVMAHGASRSQSLIPLHVTKN
jgi:hypothetical protein